jgi:hypothetical protein
MPDRVAAKVERVSVADAQDRREDEERSRKDKACQEHE